MELSPGLMCESVSKCESHTTNDEAAVYMHGCHFVTTY